MSDWDEFRASRQWQPVAAYDRDQEPLVLLRAGDDWAFGFWGAASDAADHEPAWRDAQESIDL